MRRSCFIGFMTGVVTSVGLFVVSLETGRMLWDNSGLGRFARFLWPSASIFGAFDFDPGINMVRAVVALSILTKGGPLRHPRNGGVLRNVPCASPRSSDLGTMTMVREVRYNP
jgi:hypothetical protein